MVTFFKRFFLKIQKTGLFTFFERLHTFSRTTCSSSFSLLRNFVFPCGQKNICAFCSRKYYTILDNITQLGITERKLRNAHRTHHSWKIGLKTYISFTDPECHNAERHRQTYRRHSMMPIADRINRSTMAKLGPSYHKETAWVFFWLR